ncbi:MAG: hypothetical protein OXC71_00110 [Chloroflexi bacterium]|nr:hypothetical protein [Chloroflexota bacterium]
MGGAGVRDMAQRSGTEAMRLARGIYERDVRAEAERSHLGEFVAIDVDSGLWRFAGSEIEAARALRADVAEATAVCVLRVGYRAVASIGGGALRTAHDPRARPTGSLEIVIPMRLGGSLRDGTLPSNRRLAARPGPQRHGVRLTAVRAPL